MTAVIPAPIDRFYAKVEKRDDACWQWRGATTPKGYGLFSYLGGLVYAHRFAYQVSVGPIPEGLHIDHLCRNRACVNPAHLEAVTVRENNRRSQPYRPRTYRRRRAAA